MKRIILYLLTGCLLAACGENEGPQVVAQKSI